MKFIKEFKDEINGCNKVQRVGIYIWLGLSAFMVGFLGIGSVSLFSGDNNAIVYLFCGLVCAFIWSIIGQAVID